MALNESLKTLETLMNEFFDENTSNDRKREIEISLNDFNNEQGVWRHCLYFLSNTQNEYVMMFCLNVLENIIKEQWISMLGTEKGEIRSATYQYLLACHQNVPLSIRNKLGKLNVDIGRLDWPHFYPEFFSNILQLVQSTETASLGLMLLQTVSEEFAFPRDDISISRKEELYRLLAEQVPNILNVVGGLLDLVLEKHHCLATATPPPSPTHGQDSDLSPFNTPLYPGSLLHSMFKSLSNKNLSQSIPILDTESYQLCVQGLNCLSHFFSWIPLSMHINSSLLTTIFQFASFGCDSLLSHNQTLTGKDIQSTLKKGELGMLAMGCINEIMSRNCIPSNFDDFLLQMSQYTFYLLQQLTKDENTTSSTNNNRLLELDENYIEKFTDFLRLFVNIHLQRFESNAQFSVIEFLSLLFKYTFLQPTHTGFFSCLEIWGTFLDYLTIQLKNNPSNHSVIINRYKETLVSLVNQILRKLQFKYNQSNLEELDDESLDEDCETEWQHFLQQCLNTIARVADLLPAEVFTLLYSIFNENQEIYLGLERYVQNSCGSIHSLQITAENECRRLHCSLRDLSSLLQGLGRLEYHFIGNVFEERFVTAETTVTRLCESAVYSNRLRPYNMKTAVPSVLKPDFIEVHAQVLATLKAFSHWMFLYSSQVLEKKDREQEYIKLITTVVQVAITNINEKVPEKIAHSACHLLKSVTSVIRPSFLCNLESIQQLYAIVCQGKLNLPLESQKLVHRSISNILLLPWPNVSNDEQQWESRYSRFEEFVKSITSSFRQIQHAPNFSIDKYVQEQAKPVIKWTISLLHDMIVNFLEATTKTKQLCFKALQENIEIAVSLVPIYLNFPDVSEEILDFFLMALKVFKSQMGIAFVEQTIQKFLSLFTRDQLTECILREGSAGCHVVEKFLEVLQQIVKDPVPGFRSFLISILNFCMNDIYPIVADSQSFEIKQVLFELLYQILVNNWRFFFKSDIVSNLSRPGNDTIENIDYFTKIMEAYGQTFLQHDITLFRQNLQALENLNNKWKLYHKTLFKNLMINQFLNVLLQALIYKSHELLYDDICITIYNMASVNFENFYTVFLPHFLENCSGLDNSQKSILGQNFKYEKDLPTFTQILHRFINDLRYYHLCNRSLPLGSLGL
ncbi:exportin-6 [Centruroides vittatus]|uniref:exportin-6 n=1 Tax=Centruroides vittatus TaxID=120091 RepID=UPI0035105B4B